MRRTVMRRTSIMVSLQGCNRPRKGMCAGALLGNRMPQGVERSRPAHKDLGHESGGVNDEYPAHEI